MFALSYIDKILNSENNTPTPILIFDLLSLQKQMAAALLPVEQIRSVEQVLLYSEIV